jgi:DNA-binding transcriptional LysR family regulator
VQPEFELATSDMIVQFVRRNLGVGCVMRDFARDYVESGLLFELRFNKMIPKRQFCVVRNTKMPMAPAAEKLLEIMELDAAAATKEADINGADGICKRYKETDINDADAYARGIKRSI